MGFNSAFKGLINTAISELGPEDYVLMGSTQGKRIWDRLVGIWARLWTARLRNRPTFTKIVEYSYCSLEWNAAYSPEFIGLSLWIQTTPLQACSGPYSPRRLMLPELLEIRHMQVVRLSALRTSRLCSQDIYYGYSFWLVAESTQGP